mmetsp:Transcript_74426/g.187534  ORF Transcript_74426/g.187534 Transcript_74426/m.187534 type:complete len:222 (-) Transcript_74426:156-821(-)
MMALPHLRAIGVVVLMAAVEAMGTAATLVVSLVAADTGSTLSNCDASTNGRTTPNRSVTMPPAVARLVQGCHPVVNLCQIQPALHSSATGEVWRRRACRILATLRSAAPIAACHEPIQRSLRDCRHYASNRDSTLVCIHAAGMALANLRAIRVVLLMAAVQAVWVATALIVVLLHGANEDPAFALHWDASTDGHATPSRPITVPATVAWFVEGRHPVMNLW